jgi:DNA-binding transcriptional ArsR family regulator
MSMEKIIREQARLIILKALAKEVNETSNSDLLRYELQTFGLDKSRAWIHDELAYLREMGAITVSEAGTVKVVTLAEKGAEHLRRQIAIEGVQRPSRTGE